MKAAVAALFVFAVLLTAALLITLKIAVELSVSIRDAYASATLMLFFGLVPVKIRAHVFFALPEGALISISGGVYKPVSELKKKAKNMPRLSFFKFGKVNELSFSGRVGFEGYPDKNVLIAGCMQTLFGQVSAALTGKPARSVVEPVFDGTALALNVAGILQVSPGKLLSEAIKSRRRQKWRIQ